MSELRFFKRMAGLSDKEKSTKVLDVEWEGRLEPVTWNVIRIEVLGNTKLGQQMIDMLLEKDLI